MDIYAPAVMWKSRAYGTVLLQRPRQPTVTWRTAVSRRTIRPTMKIGSLFRRKPD